MYRQLTCPKFGLTSAIIRETCVQDTKITKALSVLCAYGPFLFAKVGEESQEALRHRLNIEIAQIQEGKGDDLIDGAMDWVRVVQMRALRGHAAEYSQCFDEAWITIHYYLWGNQSKH